MLHNAHDITKKFEEELAHYCGSRFAVAVDCGSNAMYMCLMYVGVKDMEIELPSHTYMSAPCDVIRAGGRVKFVDSPSILTGAYTLWPTKIIDSALRFSGDMYIPETLMCLSFTGPYKHLKLGKGGAVLTDSEDAYKWLKRYRFSGRNECSYHTDTFDMIGMNCYMMPEIAARALLLMNQFYTLSGSKVHNKDLSLPYPDLSKHSAYKTQVEQTIY